MFSLTIALLALFTQITLAVNPLSVNGSDFVDTVTGNRFQIVGVAYQPGGSSGFTATADPLSDPATCLRDAALMQQLGVNAIRVYSVDVGLNHDQCASIFNAVGIYMLIDVNSPLSGESIDRSAPENSYNVNYLTRVFGVVEAFKDYPNTLLFFAGNEVINTVETGAANPPFIRAVTRDLRNYIAKHASRSIPVGYSAADVRDILVDTFNYLQCTLTPDSPTTDPSRSDIFALNSYSWCGAATFTSSGYDVITGFFVNTSVPVFFSEYGCNQVQPRIFTEVQAIYGPQMAPILSGGLVFEYIQETNDFGLVNVSTDGSAQLRGDFDALQNQYNSVDFATLQAQKPLNTSNVPPTCSASLISGDGFSTNFTLPAVPAGAQTLITNGLSNPNNGKIVNITQTSVSQVVQGSSGSVIEGLAIKPLPSDESNIPSGNDTSGGAVSTTSPTASATSTATSTSASASTTTTKSAGAPMEIKTWLVGLMSVVAVLACL